jgi:hypothetical protein
MGYDGGMSTSQEGRHPGMYTTVSTEWSLFTVEQARNFGPDVIAARTEWHDYGHRCYDGLITARSTAND